MGRFRSISTTSPPRDSSAISGRYLDGSVSSCSRKMPSRVIFDRICRSAAQETAMPTGHEAPCRGMRTTRTSWQKYFPPNCAPMPISWLIFSTLASMSRSRKACPYSLPSVGRVSRKRALASLAVLSVYSAEVPPTTMARWYGGQAAVPRMRSFSSTNSRKRFSFSSARVSWNRRLLFAEPPPLVMNMSLYSSPRSA